MISNLAHLWIRFICKDIDSCMNWNLFTSKFTKPILFHSVFFNASRLLLTFCFIFQLLCWIHSYGFQCIHFISIYVHKIFVFFKPQSHKKTVFHSKTNIMNLLISSCCRLAVHCSAHKLMSVHCSYKGYGNINLLCARKKLPTLIFFFLWFT